MTRTFLTGLLAAPLILAGCGAKLSTERAAMTACEAAVEKAAGMLPDGMMTQINAIEAGQSGSAVSCAVQSDTAHLMVDATVTCTGDMETLSQCTAIDAVQTMQGELLYP